MRFPVLMDGIIALLTFFVLVGIALTFRAMAHARAATRAAGTLPPKRSLKRRVRDYVGPIDRSHAPLNPPLRVAVEFVCALGGFPGLGWLLSGRIFTGLLLMCIVPSLVWGIVPVVLSMTGLLLISPYSVVFYLPALAAVSASSLAFVEMRGSQTAEAHQA
jgi:hypothetical protein